MTPLEPGKNLTVATLMNLWIVVTSATLERPASFESWKHSSLATLLASRIVESMSTRHSSSTRNMPRRHPIKATLLKPRIIANPTTLLWEQIAWHVFGNDSPVAAFLFERVVALSIAAQPFTLDASGNHLAFAASLIFTVVHRVTTTFRHAFAEWGQAPQNNTVTTARSDKRIVDPFTAATATTLAHAFWALTQVKIRSFSEASRSFYYI